MTGRPDAAAFEGLPAAVNRELEAMLARPLQAGLYLVATPIGNLGDIGIRALAVLARADDLYCEDTRHSRSLLTRYAVHRKLLSLHQHNEEGQIGGIVARVSQGASVAVISDAGTPLISDPGYKLVRAVVQSGHPVFAIPGPSAVVAALVSSGLPSDCFTFAGFLPAKSGQRLERLKALGKAPGTLVIFEGPSRVRETLKSLEEVYGATTPAAIVRELTKIHEEARFGDLAGLSEWAGRAELRGEFVILLAPVRTPGAEISDDEIVAALSTATEESLRDRVTAVATRLRIPRKKAYDLAMRSRKDWRDG